MLSFFGHLVDVLGPAEFTAPVCLLLVDKVGNRVVRQEKDEVRASLSLALSILQRYPAPAQVEVQLVLAYSTQINSQTSRFTQALNELLQECERLVLKAVEPDTPQVVFLDSTRYDPRRQVNYARLIALQ